jgi:hypothetical protein
MARILGSAPLPLAWLLREEAESMIPAGAIGGIVQTTVHLQSGPKPRAR